MEAEKAIPNQIALEDVRFEHHIDTGGDGLVHFSATLPGFKGQGFGTDYSTELALKKAFNELIERIYFHHVAERSKTSSGFAAHDTYAKAEASAMAELIERDVFLTSWLTKRAPQWLDSASIHEHGQVFEHGGCKVVVGVLARVLDHHCVVSALLPQKENEFGAVISSAANLSFEAAVRSTTFELRRALEWIQIRRRKGGPIFLDLEESGVNSSLNHMEFYLNPRHSARLKWFFEKGEALKQTSYSKSDIQFDRFPSIRTPWPISVVRARSERVQNYFVGATEAGKVNPLLTQSNRVVNWDMHPLP